LRRDEKREARGLTAYRAREKRETSPARQTFSLILAVLLVVGIGYAGRSVWQFANERPTTASGERRSTDSVGVVGDFQNLAGRLFVSLQAGDADQPGGTDPTPVRFEVRSGESAADIAERLNRQGLIRDATLFRLLLRVQGVDTKLEAGSYELRQTMSMREIVAVLQRGRPPSITVTIPEGWRAEEIAALLAGQGLVDAAEFMRLVKSGEGFSHPFLADRPAGAPAGLEGYLFPDTYTFDTGASDARRVLTRLLDNFGARVDPEVRQAAKDSAGSLYQALALAAIVEREARIASERPLIAGVYANRLKRSMKLDADPTVQYGMGFDKERGTWWRPLIVEDYKFASVWNTYVNPGLPPGPICNPGLSSIRAAVAPTPTDYVYFVARTDGSHVFARTFEEHVRNVNTVK
jgi:UPF0755 protein